MSYLRNGNRVFTASDKAKQAIRRAHDISYSPLGIYRKADRDFSLKAHNVDATIAYVLRHNDISEVSRTIGFIRCDIANRRFEMFSTLQFQHDHIWREGVSASGDYQDRQAWLYFHECQLKFWLKVAQCLNISVGA